MGTESKRSSMSYATSGKNRIDSNEYSYTTSESYPPVPLFGLQALGLFCLDQMIRYVELAFLTESDSTTSKAMVSRDPRTARNMSSNSFNRSR
jgi:hypothetical protein